MKKPLFLLFSAGAFALSLAGCASSSVGRPVAVAAHTLEINHPPDIGLPFPADDGTAAILSRLTLSAPVGSLDKAGVLGLLGRPTERLTPEIWVYWQYCSPGQAAEAGGHDTLVVAFGNDQVLGMKLVDGDVLRKHLSGRRHRTATPL